MRKLLHAMRSKPQSGSKKDSRSPSRSEAEPLYGLRLLHEPSSDAESGIDIVFIHGLTGSAFDTWYNAETEFYWPSSVGPSTGTARVFTFGYDADVASFWHPVSQLGIDNHAKNLLGALARLRSDTQTENRKIFIIAHSLGGLVMQDAICLSQTSAEQHIRQVGSSIASIMFLGTPHFGSNLAAWAKLASNIAKTFTQPAGNIVRVLEPDSEMLASIQDRFHNILRLRRDEGAEILITCFCEELPYPVVGEVVPKRSAILPGYPNYSIRANHQNMTRFRDAKCEEYQAVLGEIRRWTRKLQGPSPDRRPLSTQETACLQCLYRPGYEDDRTRRAITPVEGTCDWLLSHDKYRYWREERRSSFLWISGYPGCGKSHLASFVANLLRSEPAGADPGEIVCSFFFQHDDEKWNSATSAIGILVHQLFITRPALLKHALPHYQSKGGKLADDFNSLWSIFTASLADPKCGPVVWVVDALDECHESSSTLLINTLAGFDSVSAHASLKILVTGRPDAALVNSLPSTRLELERETSATTKDVKRVVDLRMQEICARKGISDPAHRALVERLLENANQTFLWVSLIMQMISDSAMVSRSALDELLGTLPGTLNETYSRTLKKSTNPDKAREMLHMIVAAARPLSLRELNVAFSIRRIHHSVQDLDADLEPRIEQTVRGLCGLFVRVVESTVYLVHQTAREFLVNPTVSESKNEEMPWKGSLRLVESNAILAERCIWYLLLAQFETDPLLYHPARRNFIPGQDARLNDYIHQYTSKYDFLSYAVSSWATHFREIDSCAHPETMQLSSELCNTKTKRFQTWFQVRCFLGHDCVVQQLLDSGIDVAERTGDGIASTTALHIASHAGHAAVVELLLEKKADISARNGKGATALFEAASRGHDAVVKLLLDAGSDIHTKNLTEMPIVLLPALSEYESTLKLLLARGADIYATYRGDSTLGWVVTGQKVGIMRVLFATGVDVNTRTGNGETLLHRAATFGCAEMVALLLDYGADLHAQNSTGTTVLSYAVRNGGIGIEKVVSLLISRGADIAESTTGGITLLHLASMTGSAALVSLLIRRGAAINAKDAQSRTPLHYACGEGRGGPPEGRIDLLLNAGANLTARAVGGQTPLHHAVIVGSEEKVTQLLGRGASAQIQDDNGNTPLHHAALHGREKIVDVLLKNGADIEATNASHEPALHLACLKGHTSVIEALLRAGADLTAQSSRGSAIHLALGCGSTEIMHLLLAHGADINAPGPHGETALMLAVALRENSLIRCLVDGGADVSARSMTDGGTALHIAAQQGLDVPMVQLLVDHGADVNARGYYPAGETPLHIAAQHGQHAIARVLLASGADVQACYATGETALHRAAVFGQAAMASWLLDNDADINATTDNDTALSLAALRGQNPVVEVLVGKGASPADINRALIYAAGGGHVAVMETLVRAGAHLDIQDMGGTSPLHIAVERNQVLAVQWLCSAGADITVQNPEGQSALDVACALDHSETARVLREATQSGSESE